MAKRRPRSERAVELSAEQDRALDQVHAWLQGPAQVFRLFGGAGTGKTTLARYFAEGVQGQVYFSAFTGKATYVLRQKGCPNAMTLHKLIYIPRGRSAARLVLLEEERDKLPPGDPKRAKLDKDIAEETLNLSRPAFTLNTESPLKSAKLLVVDEVSMVDQQMGEDLLSFGCKVLVLGDPNQLPPVYGTGYFTEQKPDVLLREIHRQARDNPIIRLAAMIREQEMPSLGSYGDSRVLGAMDATMAQEADQMLVGRNKTRTAFNRRMRALRGFEGDLPLTGDKLVCLRNSGEHPLLNGSIWHVTEPPVDVNENMAMLKVRDPDGTGVECLAHKQHFRGEQVPWWAKKDAEEFDYGYALTTHKSQGSQWDDVLVYDESRAFRDDRWRWLYTAVTRAAKRVTIVRES